MCAQDEDTQKAMLAEQGVTWNEVDLDAFTAACAPVYDWMVEECGADPELKDKLVKLVQDFRASK
jgi:TRAP-type C4-dicarboxylate transport system substrate-binding protein